MRLFKLSTALLFLPFLLMGQGGRVPEPGIPIVLLINAPDVVLQKFTKVQAVGFLKDGKQLNVEWRGDARKVNLATFGMRATEEEKKTRHVYNDGQKIPKLWGVEDKQGNWHDFDEFERVVIEHTTETEDKTFDGYRTEIRFIWNGGWQIGQPGQLPTFFGAELSAQLKTRLVGRRVEFLLESETGPPALRPAQEQVQVQIEGTGTPSTAQYTGGEEVILPENTRVTGCTLGAGSQSRYSLASNCQWTWSAGQGPAKVVLLGKDVDLVIPFDRDGVTAAPKFNAMAAYLTRANGNLVQAGIAPGTADTLVIKGTTTMTSARFSLTGDNNFEDLDSVEVKLDGSKLKLLRRRPGVVILLDATQPLNPIRDVVIPQVAKAADELRTSPLMGKVTFAVSQAENYETVPDLGKIREYFAGYRIDALSNPMPVAGLGRAARDAGRYNAGIDSVKNRIVYIAPNDLVMERPWRDNERPFDPNKLELFVIELGFKQSTPSAKEFMDKFFGAAASSHYRFVRTPEELSRTILECALGK